MATTKMAKTEMFLGWEYFLGATVKQMFDNRNG